MSMKISVDVSRFHIKAIFLEYGELTVNQIEVAGLSDSVNNTINML